MVAKMLMNTGETVQAREMMYKEFLRIKRTTQTHNYHN